MMKATNTGRKLYLRKGATHLCFAGQLYGMYEASALDLETPVKVTVNEDGTVTVTQRKNHAKGRSETWSTVKIA
jgi:hypothetical protein